VEYSNDIAEEAISLATKWRRRADQLQTARERARNRKLARLYTNFSDKVIVTKLIDRSFRSVNARRVAEQIHHLLNANKIPEFFSPWEKALMIAFLYAGRLLPALTVPAIIKKMRRESSHLIVPGEGRHLKAFLKTRRDQGIRVNINHIGEEVLGEEDALARLRIYIQDLKNPAFEFISIKTNRNIICWFYFSQIFFNTIYWINVFFTNNE